MIELNNKNITSEEKKKIADLFTSNNYLNGWINAIRNSNYSFILQDKDDNTLLFKGSNLSNSESKYLLNKNFGNFAQLIRKFCKILDDTIFSIYKLNFDKKLGFKTYYLKVILNVVLPYFLCMSC